MNKHPKPPTGQTSFGPVDKDSPFEILSRNGFIGSCEGPADLSVRVKEEIAEYLVKKHDER